MSQGITTTLRGLIANSYAIRVDGTALLHALQKLGNEVIAAMAIPFLLLVLAAAARQRRAAPAGLVDWSR